MSKTEILHELYEQCKDIDFDESYDIVSSAKNPDEKDFFKTVTDFILCQKQKKAIAEKRF